MNFPNPAKRTYLGEKSTNETNKLIFMYSILYRFFWVVYCMCVCFFCRRRISPILSFYIVKYATTSCFQSSVCGSRAYGGGWALSTSSSSQGGFIHLWICILYAYICFGTICVCVCVWLCPHWFERTILFSIAPENVRFWLNVMCVCVSVYIRADQFRSNFPRVMANMFLWFSI